MVANSKTKYNLERRKAPNDKGNRKLLDHFLLLRAFCLRLKLLNYSIRRVFCSAKLCIQFTLTKGSRGSWGRSGECYCYGEFNLQANCSFFDAWIPECTQKALLSLIFVALFSRATCTRRSISNYYYVLHIYHYITYYYIMEWMEILTPFIIL